jgi:hypothetical protein
MSYAPFPIIPELTALAVAYKNPTLIADDVLPRVPVSTQAFEYMQFDKGETFTVPDTRVGRTAAPTQVEFSGTKTGGVTNDYALDAPIPNQDVENAKSLGGKYDPKKRATASTTDLILLDREVRVASAVFDANNYAAANKTTLAGVNQWSDTANSDPLRAILTAFDSMIMRPTLGVIGQLVATQLQLHPKLVAGYFGNNGQYGLVPLAYIAEQLGLQKLLVGRAFINSAKPGQAVSIARAWGKHASFLYIDPNADTNRGITYGLTAQWGPRVAGEIEDPDIGMRGGVRVRVGESVAEKIIATDCGYFFQNAIA